jgi:hypothetical protein
MRVAMVILLAATAGVLLALAWKALLGAEPLRHPVPIRERPRRRR